MKKIAVLEDVRSHLADFVESLCADQFTDTDGEQIVHYTEADIEQWWVLTETDFWEAVTRAQTSECDMLVADLKLFESRSGELRRVADECRRRVVGSPYERDLLFWTRTAGDALEELYPGAFIAEEFCRAKPGKRWVLVASNFNRADALGGWMRSLPSACADVTGFINKLGWSSIHTFIQRFHSDWCGRLLDGTEDWFDRLNPKAIPPHDPPYEAESTRLVLDRLKSVFGFTPPNHWFEGEQFVLLCKRLQGMIGAHANACGGPNYNINVDNLIILLGVAMGNRRRAFSDPTEILSKISWTGSSLQLLPAQQTHDARQSLRRLVAFFEDFIVDRSKPTIPRLIAPRLSPGSLELLLDFDCRRADPGRTPLLDRVNSKSDDRFTWFTTVAPGQFSFEIAPSGDKTLMVFSAVKPAF